MASEGLRLGRYELKRALGEGGNGQVFLAWQENAAGEPLVCVVKFPLQQFATKSDACDRFISEARLAMRLGSHPNIVQVIDVGMHHEMPFIVMEYVDGTDLRRLLRRLRRMNRALSLAAVYNILASAATALHHAHVGATVARAPVGVIHRDVKPANVLVTRDGMVKLADFGIGTTLEDGTSGQFIRGTFRYMSPEHVRCEARPEMDVYALGVVAWEMLENRPYREDYEETQHLAAIMAGEIPPMLNPRTPPRLAKLVEACLESDPRHRPNARELLRALEQCPGYSRDPSELQRVIASTHGPHRSSGKTHQQLALTPELVATFAALTVKDSLRRSSPAEPRTPWIPPWATAEAVDPAADRDAQPLGDLAPPLEPSPAPSPIAIAPSPASEQTTATAIRVRRTPRAPVLSLVFGSSMLAILSALAVIVLFGERPHAPLSAAPAQIAGRAQPPSATPSIARGPAPLEPTRPEPEPAHSEPEPTRPEPAPTRPAPEPTRPEPEPAHPEPARPDPAPTRPEPESARPDPEPAPPRAESASARAEPRPATAQKSRPTPTVPVKLVLFLLDEAQIQLGRETFTVRRGTEVQVAAGRHRLRWRAKAGDAWRDAGRKTFRVGKLYMIRVRANGDEEFVELDAATASKTDGEGGA